MNANTLILLAGWAVLGLIWIITNPKREKNQLFTKKGVPTLLYELLYIVATIKVADWFPWSNTSVDAEFRYGGITIFFLEPV